MKNIPYKLGCFLTNPLNTLEEIVSSNGWLGERLSEEEMLLEINGPWSTYSLYFMWRENTNNLSLSCGLNLRVPREKLSVIYELLGLINEKLWVGHFEVTTEDRTLLFRYNLLANDNKPASRPLLEDLIDIACSACEQFYPAFQFVIQAGKTAREALISAILDTVGEA